MARKTDIIFDKESHTYRLMDGTELSGITGRIQKVLGIDYKGAPEFYRSRGTTLHEQLDSYIKGKSNFENEAVRILKSFVAGKGVKHIEGEFLISDYKMYATAVDVVCFLNDKDVMIMDLKTGKFNLEYLSIQLGINKKFMEETLGLNIVGCYCIHLPSNQVISVIPKDTEYLNEVLYG